MKTFRTFLDEAAHSQDKLKRVHKAIDDLTSDKWDQLHHSVRHWYNVAAEKASYGHAHPPLGDAHKHLDNYLKTQLNK